MKIAILKATIKTAALLLFLYIFYAASTMISASAELFTKGLQTAQMTPEYMIILEWISLVTIMWGLDLIGKMIYRMTNWTTETVNYFTQEQEE